MLRTKLASLLALLGAGLLVWGTWTLWREDSSPSSTSANLVIGTVAHLVGDVQSRKARALRFEPVAPGHALATGETVKTGASASAEILLATGLRFSMGPDAQITAEADIQRPGHLTLTSPLGTLGLIEAGDPGRVRFFRDGKEFDPSRAQVQAVNRIVIDVKSAQAALRGAIDEEPGIVATTSDEPLPSAPVENAPAKAGVKQATPAGQQLTREDIHRAIRMQSGFLQRCYLSYVDRRQGRTGKGAVVVSFVISAEGKAAEFAVSSSQFKDDDLHNCLGEVLARAQFPSFHGSAVHVEYPIVFE